MPKNKKSPLLVIVHNGRYDIVGAPTFRNIWLANFLKKLGGVSDTVAEGYYDFDVKVQLIPFRYIATLEPVKN